VNIDISLLETTAAIIYNFIISYDSAHLL